MKKILIGTVALLALAGAAPALAADIPAPVYKAPIIAPAPLYSWTGFYVGGNVGYSWGRWNSTSIGSIFPDSALGVGTTASPGVNGWLGGVQAGYNWQVDPRWVIGVEADGQITGERARAVGSLSVRATEPGGDFNDVLTLTSTSAWKLPWFATFRGRVGLLADPQTLFYATGGLAVGNFKFSNQRIIVSQRFGPGSTGTIPALGAPFFPSFVGPALSDSQTLVGLAVGAGIERKITKNWSVKLEYLYLDFGSHTFLSGTGFDTNIRLRDHIARVGLNYEFDWVGVSPAVVTKY